MVTDDYSFDGWGKLTISTGSTANSQLYKGEYLAYRKDPDAGPELQYSTHHRNYNPQTGVFTAADPAKDDLNLYRYVKNNPVNQVDPSGLQEEPRRFHASVKPAFAEAKEDPLAAHPELLEWRNQHEQLFRRIAGILALPIENGLGAGIDLSTININTKHGQLSREIEWHEVGREGSVIYTPFGIWAPPLSWTYGILWTEAETQAPPIRIPYDAYDPDSKDLAFQLVLRSRNYDDLMELGKSIGEAVGSAPEKALRAAFPVLDAAGTVVDTVDSSVKYLNAGPGGGGGDWKSVAINILQGYLFYKMWRTARPAKDADTPGRSTQRPASEKLESDPVTLVGRNSTASVSHLAELPDFARYKKLDLAGPGPADGKDWLVLNADPKVSPDFLANYGSRVDMSHLPSNHFDEVGGFGVQFDTPEQQAIALSEVFRAMKPGGTLEFTSRQYHGNMLDELRKVGFKNSKITGGQHPGRLMFNATK